MIGTMFQNPALYPQARQGFRRRNNDYYEDEINNLFNKKFVFRFDPDWRLPERDSWFTAPPWRVPELDTLKTRLNYHKSQLNDFNIEEWSCHTRRRNPAGEVCWKLKTLINPEFLTQAWTKFYECACTFKIIPEKAVNNGRMVSLHLCEAPGAFITSLNHYLKCNHPDIDWQWLATTLNPYFEGNSLSNMISDDRFMFHTLEHWDFGADCTGNLMEWDNSQALIKRATTLGEVLLVTADGSIDCLQKPDAQEEITSPLHYCEIITALQALSPGGTLIFKLFTMFEHSTVCLMYLINHLFEEVNIYKPVTSRQGNSEVYAVCLNYYNQNLLNPYLDILKNGYGNEIYQKYSLFPLDCIPKDFIKQIEECSNYFCSMQCQVIDNNYQAYVMQNAISPQLDIKRLRALVSAEYLRLYDLKPLMYKEEILKGILHEEYKINTNPRYHKGSYNAREGYKSLCLKDKLKSLQDFLQSDIVSNASIFFNETVRWVKFFEDDFKQPIVFNYGKRYEKIFSSKFIFVPIFKLYQQILDEKEFVSLIENESLTENRPFKCKEHLNEFKTVTFPKYTARALYSNYENCSFNILMDVLKDIEVGESILLVNFNVLTHFNVSLVFLLAKKCFKKIGFCSDGIYLCDLCNKLGLDCLFKVQKEYANNTDEKGILNLLPIPVLYDCVFLNNIVFYNNTFYRNLCIDYLSLLQIHIN